MARCPAKAGESRQSEFGELRRVWKVFRVKGLGCIGIRVLGLGIWVSGT